MNLTALFISVGIVTAVCVVFWLLNRVFDIDMEDIATWFIYAICFAAAVGMIYLPLYIFTAPKEDLEHTREVVYEIDNQFSDNREEKQSECSIFADSCVVDEWDFECLFTKCIIDARK